MVPRYANQVFGRHPDAFPFGYGALKAGGNGIVEASCRQGEQTMHREHSMHDVYNHHGLDGTRGGYVAIISS